MVMDFNAECRTCGHKSLKHRDFVGPCRECHCKSFITGSGKKLVSPLKSTRAEREFESPLEALGDRYSRLSDRVEAEPIRIGKVKARTVTVIDDWGGTVVGGFGDVGKTIEKEARKLAKKRRKP
jgi:hypothetical protein